MKTLTLFLCLVFQFGSYPAQIPPESEEHISSDPLPNRMELLNLEMKQLLGRVREFVRKITEPPEEEEESAETTSRYDAPSVILKSDPTRRNRTRFLDASGLNFGSSGCEGV